MRVLFYNHAGEISGAERGLLSIMRLAHAAGHTVVLCAPPGALARQAAGAGITVVPVAPLVLGYTRNPVVLAGYLARAARPLGQLARAMQQYRPDAVHANSIRSGLVAAMAVRLVRPRPSLVVHVRDALRRNLLDRLVAGVIGREASSIVAISRYTARNTGWPAGTLHVVHNAIDPAQYRAAASQGQAFRHRLGVPFAAPLLVVVGQLTPWKG